MEKIIRELAKELAQHIIADLQANPDKKFLVKLVDAHNTFCENELDGQGYLFDINKQEDLVCVTKGGLTAKEIAAIYTRSQSTTPYFWFDATHETPTLIHNWSALAQVVKDLLPEVALQVLAYPNEYSDLYNKYIAETALTAIGR